MGPRIGSTALVAVAIVQNAPMGLSGPGAKVAASITALIVLMSVMNLAAPCANMEHGIGLIAEE